MATRGKGSLVRRLRRGGTRLHSGPWTLYVGARAESERRLFVSLGRTAGPAVARSRIRRIARSVFANAGVPSLDASILLTARAFVGEVPRTELRAAFIKLKDRAAQVLSRQGTSPA
ncbi:MAG: ribonuclease P protein component [Candidatus Methylomirabilales bacterium]